MSEISKRDVILEAIIKAYLAENTPIGSSELCLRMEYEIPASTIRVYFKKLSDEGALTKLHISGGRIPTDLAMKKYWKSRIDTNRPLVIENKASFGSLVSDFGIYCLVSKKEEMRLTEVINTQNRFLIMVFAESEIVIKYDEKIEFFLKSLLGQSAEDLIKICLKVNLFSVAKKIKDFLSSKILFDEGKIYIYNLLSKQQKEDTIELLSNYEFVTKFDDGLIFDDYLPKGAMAIKQNAFFDGQEAKVFCLGNLYTDFEQFFIKIKEDK